MNTYSIQPSSIYNSWHDHVPPLREELREFKSWPNYTPLRFAPSALCSQKVERTATAHTKAQTRTYALLSEQTACFTPNSPVSTICVQFCTQYWNYSFATSDKSCHMCIVNLHFSFSKTQSIKWKVRWFRPGYPQPCQKKKKRKKKVRVTLYMYIFQIYIRKRKIDKEVIFSLIINNLIINVEPLG